MKKIVWIPVLILLIAVLGGFTSISNDMEMSSSGDKITTSRNVDDFSELQLEGVYNVYILPGKRAGLKVEASERVQDRITVKNKGNKLIVQMDDDKSIKKGEGASLYITVTELNSIEGNIVGNIIFKEIIKTDVFTLNVNGVGKNSIKIDCNQFNSNIASVGELILEGRCKSANITHSGVGSLKAFNFICDYLSTTHSGIGSVEVYADKKLDVSCSGIGSVYYKGAAKEKTINVTGLGKVRRK